MSTRTRIADGQALITHHVRRQVCSILDRRGTIAVSALAARLADRSAISSIETETEAAIALRHVHLPSLADWGIVDYDPAGETVSIADGVSFAESDAGLATVVVDGSGDGQIEARAGVERSQE